MYKLAPLLIVTLLAGCAALGVAPANTFNKRAVVANATIESTAVTVQTLYEAGKLDKTDANAAIQQLLDAARGIDLAREIYEVDPTQASDRLSAIVVTLQALDAYLRTKQ